MDKELVLKTLQAAKQNSPKRNFKQSVDLVINLKDLDMKKPEHQLNLFVPMPFGRGRKVTVCALVGLESLQNAKKACDDAIAAEDFGKYDKKKAKKLANQFDFFIAHAPIMAKIASAFGPIFGPRGKMPNPKAGCVIPPNVNIAPLYQRLQNMVRITMKSDPIVHCMVGKEDSKEEEVVDNVMTVYNAVIRALPNEENNVKSAYLKLTMGKPVRMGQEAVAEKETDSKGSKKKHSKKTSKKTSKSPKQEASTEAPEESPKEEKPIKEKPAKEKAPKKSKK